MGTRFGRKRGDEGAEHKPSDSEGGAAPHEAPAENAGEDAAAEAPSLEELTRQRDQYLEMWQRANADYQNLRRRGLADMEVAARRAKESLLHDLLLVLDYLEMALATDVKSDEAKNLAVGVRMTRDQLLGVLDREGVRPVPDGGAFDPRVHQAVSTIESEDVEPGQVVATVRRGYVLGEHPLRHAHVQVSTAPGEALSADETAED